MVVLSQLFVKALFARTFIASSRGTLVNREDMLYKTKMPLFAISKLRISFTYSTCQLLCNDSRTEA